MSIRHKNAFLWIIIILIVIIAGIQIIGTFYVSRESGKLLEEFDAFVPTNVQDEKSRIEAFSIRFQNQMKTMFWNSLLATLGPTITAIVAILGALLGFRNYLDTKEKDRIDRGADDLKNILGYLVSESPRERAMGVISLQHFLTEDKREYHRRVLASLATTARLEDDKYVKGNITATFCRAVEILPDELVREISWHKAKLGGVSARKMDLHGIDFRDADLEDADLSGTILTQADFRNTTLKGAKLNKAHLEGADLTYADLAGADLQGAHLDEAIFKNVKVLKMNIEDAHMEKAIFDYEEIPWNLISGWRKLADSDRLKKKLVTRYGPEPSGPKVLMLMWEIPPHVVGGSWTACYHLIRNLCKRGANVTVAVPWPESRIDTDPFGCEVKVIGAGMGLPTEEREQPAAFGAYPGSEPSYPSGYSRFFPSAYGPSWGPSGYSTRYPYDSPYSYSYGSAYAYSFGSPYGYAYSPYGPGLQQAEAYRRRFRKTPTMIRLIEQFGQRLMRRVKEGEYDVVHAHDWVTFQAAVMVSEKLHIPWVAHFHSTEDDRRPVLPDFVIKGIEGTAVERAKSIVVPSEVTRRNLIERYEAESSMITVVPNCLSREEINPFYVGNFDSKEIVFLGRLTSQKNPEQFAELARHIQREEKDWKFLIYGDGDLRRDVHMKYGSTVTLKGSLAWEQRADAFAGASALIVPSRSEPFGMVVLEAMQYGVPVFCTKEAGVTDEVESIIEIDSEATKEVADSIIELLRDWNKWIDVVENQSREVQKYPDQGHEEKLIKVWRELVIN